MGAYSWQALDKTGGLKKGVWEADSPKDLRVRLRSEGLNPIKMAPVADQSATTDKKSRRRISVIDRKINSADLSIFTRQLATLIRSKLPLEEGLRVISTQTSKNWQRHLFTALRSRLSEGMSLADSFRQFPRAFPEYFAATAEAGEQAGRLEIVLERLADYAEDASATRQKIKLSLMYPAVIAVVATGVVSFLLIKIVPELTKRFVDMGIELPWLTRLIVSISHFLQNYWYWLLLAMFFTYIAFHYANKNEKFRMRWHRILLRLPFLSRVIREINTARFLRTYSILLSSTVSAPKGMTISARVLDNLPIRTSLSEASSRVREGASIGNAMTNTGFFSPMTLNLVASGEASGNLPEMLERAGENQERTLKATVSTVVGILEPLMIVVMGVLVMGIVLSILIPIMQISENIN